MTIIELYEELESLDWFYNMSDDHKAFMRGQRNMEKILKTVSSLSLVHQTLFKDYENFVFSPNNFKKPEVE